MAKYDKADLERRMKGAVESLKHDLSGLRTGRANTALLEPITVEVYGSHMPLNQVATVTAPEPRMLAVQVWDRSNVSSVEKAIRSAGLGLNPIAEGQTLRLPIPDLTEERRKEYVKVAHTKSEDAKISIRNARRSAKEHIQKLVKDGDIGEDDGHRAEKQLDDSTSAATAQVDEIHKHKESELLEI